MRAFGCVTLRDSDGLKKGETIGELLGYIEKSKICNPIFSKGYADSKWCLRKLAKVVECNKRVIPVFFDVDPSDVKSQSGEFASAFKKHESKRTVRQEEVITWREALTKVGNISGFTLKDTNGYEGKLLQIIVKKILTEVNPHHLHVGESHLEKLRMVLDVKANEVRMIGIHGMGGIGKTTLSKLSTINFLLNLKLLLKDIFQSDETITDESKGTQLIKNKIGTKKVLFILDGVDSKDQLRALLFCYHAFRSEKPPSEEYVKMCSEAVSSINGLPLALEVFGSQFFDLKTEKEWTGMLKRLKESQH
ncbi:TMV resistance protein N-like [Nymphaea colorata]|nr:TMV resistance protein N-like [Nymphaea colorata]